jgi:hypothetical protein
MKMILNLISTNMTDLYLSIIYDFIAIDSGHPLIKE